MKKTSSLIIVTVFVVSTFLLAGCGEANSSKLSVYPFKTAVIQYELNGGTVGDQTLFIKGDQKALHKFITTVGQESSTFELSLGNEKYIADLDKKTAVKTVDADYQAMLSLSAEGQEKYLIKKSLGLKENMELSEPVATSMIAGQQCDIYEIQNVGTACIWNGIVLQNEITLAGVTNKITAVKVDIDVEIPAERFELPDGIVVAGK
jgi:major membrane immunogen (membrane-anchored lipoprotein)